MCLSEYLVQDKRLVLLSPDVDRLDQLPQEVQKQVASGLINFIEEHSVDIGFSDLSTAEILRAILPEEVTEITRKFEIAGHVALMNLQPWLADYKHVIGKYSFTPD